jgi:surface antigen
MAPTRRRSRITVLATVALSLAFALPAAASAATIPAAPASQYNTTPDCPVSATDTVCAWNVPVDPNDVFSTADYGQCPYWAAEKYPALVLDELATDPLGENWNGGTWLEHAAQEGLGASTTPASGDLAVWQAKGDDTTGHIAYVEAVVGNAIIVSQMDGDSSAPFPPDQGSTEWLSADDLSYFERTYGLEFIATGDPSSTPLADVEQPPASTTTTTGTTSTKPVTKSKTVKPKTDKPKVVKQKTVKQQTAKAKAKAEAKRVERKAVRTPAAGARRRSAV